MKAPKLLVPGTIWKQCARFLILWLQIQAFLKSIEAVVEKDRYKGCGGIFTTSSGTFTSPGYPNSYPDNVLCSYIIQMNPQSRVKINILDLHLEGSGNCDFDSLTIRDGYRDDSPVLKKLCGRQMEQTVVSSKSTVLVQFVTDQGVSKRGFKAEWTEIPLIPMLSIQGISFPSPWVGIQSPRGVKQMDSGIISSLWVVTEQNEVLVYSNRAWSTVDGKMRYVTAGDSGVWGIGTDQLIYYRTDVTESNLKGNEWSAVTGNENRKFTKLESGFKGIVAGITDRGEVAFRQGISNKNPVGVYWAIMTNPIDGGQRLIDVSCGPYGCWLISSLNNVYFTKKITLSNVNSITWKRLDGIRARKITHGFGSSLWAIGVDGNLKRLLGTTILGIDNIYIQNFANIQFVEIANGLQGTYGLTTNGHIARYNDVTCGGLLTEKAGVVTSPNYPYYYPRDVTCLWIIRVNDAKSISFLIQDPFEIDRKPQCLDWIVTFRDGKYPSEFEPIKECGNVKPPMKVIRGNEFWIEFNSTGQVFGKGFQAVYEAGFSDIPITTTPAPTTTVVTTRMLPEGWKEITVPSPLSSFDTGITQDVWGFNAEGQIYVLMNGQWRKIFEDVVRQVTAGGSGVWAINRNSEIMFRSGISPSNPIGTSWIIVPSNRIFRQIDSGPHKLVATLTFDNNLLLREGISTQRPSGTDWNLLRGNVKSFSLGSYGIWIVDNKNDVYFGKIKQLSKTNGDKSSVEWTLVQGSLLTVTAGLNGQVWGVLPSGKLVKRIGINVLQPTGTRWEEVQGMYPSSLTSGVTGTYAQLQDGTITNFNDVKCGGLVTSQSGVIHSPNYPSPYPSGLTCLWIIRVPGMKVINVVFDDFELEDSIACQKDKIVTFKKGYYSPYEEPLMECGTTVKDKVVQGDTFWIEFISDNNINRRGFRFFYNAYSEQIATTTTPPQTPVNDCGKILTEPSGVIRSPGYPSTYGNNVDCLYRIQVDPEHRIRLSVVDFSLESHSTCANDWFEIYDGPTEYDLSLGRYCGSSIPSVFTSSSRRLTIKFRSNNDLGRRGFEMTWESIRLPALRTTQSTTPEPLTSPPGEIEDLPSGWIYEPPESEQRFVQLIPSTPGQLFAAEASTNRVLVLSDNRWQPVGTLTARRIAHDGFVLWALDRNGRVYALPDSQQRNPGWQSVGNDVFKSIVAGPFPLVFALKESGDLYVRNGISKSNPFGVSWRRIRGRVEDVAVNSYFIWIVEKSGQVQAAPRPISWEFMAPNWKNVDGLSATNVFAGFGPDVWILDNRGKWYRRQGTNAMRYEGVRWTELPLNFKDVAFGMNHIYGVTSSGKIARRQASQCGGLLLSKKGNIISPFFPGNYPHRMNCLWIIKVQDAKSISLRFTSFDVESSPNCNKDYLMLYRNGRYSSSNEDKVVLCGMRAQDRQVNSDEVWISFHTDSYNSATGFRILYDSTFPDTGAGSGQTVKATTLAPFYSTTPSPSLLTGCGGFLNGDHGLFASPGYPSKYPNNLKCVYKIAVDPKKSVELVFDDFDIENDNLCRFDFVHLRDGDSEFGRDLGKYCGNVNGGKFKTSGNKMWVFFRADGSVGRRGFKATWRAATSEGDGFPTFQPITPQTVTQAQPVTDSSLPSGWSPFVQEERFSHVDTGTTEAVWALRDSGQPYVLESYYFTPVQGNLFFKDITAGESGIWGISEDNKIYVRVGVAPLAVQGIYWQEVLDSPRLSTIDSGPNRVVVAVDKDNFLYQRDGITPSRPQGTRWVMMDRDVKRVSVGSYGYWLVDVNGSPYFAPHLARDRRFKKTPIEGQFRDIEAGFDGSVWAVGPDNSVYRREGISTLSPSGTNWRRIDGLRLIKISSGLTGVFGVTTTGRIVASTDRNCGGILRSRQGRITSPNHPFSYPARSSCLWIIDVPDAKQIRLSFRTFVLESSNGCTKDYVLTLRDAKFPSEYQPDKSCGSEVSTKVFRGPKAWVEFVSDGNGNFPGFEADYVAQTEVPTTEPTTEKITPTTAELIYKYCGGNILGSSGKIAHPSYPNNYLSYRDCTYVITVNRGQRILVQFEKFGLEPNTGCDNDFLEFRDGPNTDGVRLGKLCGSANPSNIRSTGEHLFIRFRTDGSSESEGFLMNWKAEDVEPGVITEKPLPITTDSSQACGALYTGFNGVVTHPGYPSFYKHNQDCVWRIYVTSGFRIQLSFDFFEMQSDRLCQSDFLEIFDGPDQRSPVILKSCGNEVLPAIYTSDNAATIRFVSDSQSTAAGFRLNWRRAPHPSTKEPEGPVTQRPACAYSETGIGGAIYHNNYPDRYRPNQDCIWTITVAPDKVVRLSIDLFELEEHFPCSKDFVAVHDGPSIQSPKKLTLCGKRPAQAFQSSSNRLTLRFVSDDDKEDLGFYIRWFAANKQITLPTEAPTTKSTTTEKEKTTTMKFERTTELSSTEATTVPTQPIFTQRPSSFFDICFGDTSGTSGIIVTPNYPRRYPARLDCSMTIRSPAGTQIVMVFKMFALERSYQCRYDSLAIKYGERASNAPTRKYCSDKNPGTLTAPGNVVYLRLTTDSSGSLAGFKIEWRAVAATGSLTHTTDTPVSVLPTGAPKCGWRLYGQSGTIRNPRFQQSDTYGVTCIYVIEVGSTSVINLDFQYFDLGLTNCATSYLLVRDAMSSDGRLLGKFCEGNIPTTLRSTGNFLWIEYKANQQQTGDTFVMNWRAETLTKRRGFNCGGVLAGNNGIISSPSFPDFYPHNVLCNWLIKAPRNSKVILRFTFFDIEDSSDCQADYVKVIDGDSSTSRVIKKSCGKRNPGIITSTGNSLWIEMKSDCKVSKNGFRALWRLTRPVPTEGPESENNGGLEGPKIITTRIPGVVTTKKPDETTIRPIVPSSEVNTDGGLILGLRGIIRSPNYPSQYPPNSFITWILRGPPNGRIRLTFHSFELEDESGCRYDYVQIRDGPSADSEEAGRFCGSRLPATYISGSNSLWVRFKSDASMEKAGFEASWQWISEYSAFQPAHSASSQTGCGGFLKQTKGLIRSPGYPKPYPSDQDCIWVIKPRYASRIQLRFSIFEVEDSRSCISDFVEIRSGDSPSGAQLARLCGRKRGLNFFSDQGAFWIHFKTDSSRSGIGFQAEWITTGFVEVSSRTRRDIKDADFLSK